MRMFVTLFLLAFVVLPMCSQIRPKTGDRGKNSLIDSSVRDQRIPSPQIKMMFERIEHGIAGGEVNLFSAYFGKQVSMSIGQGESGYFSSSQAYSVLQNYFSAHKPTQFSFSRMNETAAMPFATGRLNFVSKGNKESAQVYVSLKRGDSEWVISQFNIY